MTPHTRHVDFFWKRFLLALLILQAWYKLYCNQVYINSNILKNLNLNVPGYIIRAKGPKGDLVHFSFLKIIKMKYIDFLNEINEWIHITENNLKANHITEVSVGLSQVWYCFFLVCMIVFFSFFNFQFCFVWSETSDISFLFFSSMKLQNSQARDKIIEFVLICLQIVAKFKLNLALTFSNNSRFKKI